MTKYLLFCSFLFIGCASSATNIAISSDNYKPVDSSLLKNVEPYEKTPKPTLKDEIERKNREECYERIRQINENQHTEPSLLQSIIDSYSCN